MGIKLGGFVCDNCSVFGQYVGVKSGLDLLTAMEQDGIYDLEEINVNMAFVKLPDWKYYRVIEMDGDWIAWISNKSICLCPKCDRILKLKELLNKMKMND